MCDLTPCQIMKIEARFLRHLKTMPNGCRIWMGARSRGGNRPHSGPYGSFRIDRQHNSVRAHVFAAFLAGKIPSLRVPAGMNLDHSCVYGTLCVDCTELVPATVNRERAHSRPIRRAGHRAAVEAGAFHAS